MPNIAAFNYSYCKTEADFEQAVADYLSSYRFKVKSTGKEDRGVDLIADAMVNDTIYQYYIQCNIDYRNRAVLSHDSPISMVCCR